MPPILLTGPTGTLGSVLLTELQQCGHRVRALSRRPESTSADETVHGDLQIPESLSGICDGVTTVVSTAGASLAFRPFAGSGSYHHIDYLGNVNLLQEALRAGVTRFVYVSVFSQGALDETAYVRAHRDFEMTLRASDIAHTIIRPTGYFPAYLPLLGIARLGVAPLIGDGSARTNPIHPVDLARVVADALLDDRADIPVGGPDELTRREMFELAFEAVGKTPRFIPTPSFMLRFNRALLRPFDRRLSELLEFFHVVSLTDGIAPAIGEHHLREYFIKQADSQ